MEVTRMLNAKLSRRLDALETEIAGRKAREAERVKAAERSDAISLKLSDAERAEIEQILAYGKEVAERLRLPEQRSPEDEYRMLKEIPIEMRRRYLEIITKHHKLEQWTNVHAGDRGSCGPS
jgi:hypothetical protein